MDHRSGEKIPTPTEVSTTRVIIIHIDDGVMGTKKKATESTRQTMDDKMNAIRFEPTHAVNFGETPPNIMHVTSPKAMKTV